MSQNSGSANYQVRDWTVDRVSGRANSSPFFLELVNDVADILDHSAFHLMRDNHETVARVILAKLAHEHGLVPGEKIRVEH